MKSLFKHWQRNLLGLLILILIGFSTWGWHWAHEPNQFPIQNVQIGGQLNFVSTDTLQNTVSPYITQGFFNVPVSKIQQALLALPGVTQVSVTRRFPSTIKINITEAIPVALYDHDSFVDTQGNIITPELLNNTRNLPIFLGSASQMPLMVPEYEKFSQLLISQDQLSIHSLSLDPLGQWEIILNNGTVIDCGNQEVEKRLSNFTKAYPTLISQNPKQQLVSVDLRYPTGFALRWQ